MKIRPRALLFVLLPAAFLASCAGGVQEQSGDVEAGPLVVGYIPDSGAEGPQAAIDALQSLELTVAELNAGGGVAGRLIRLVPCDPGSGPIGAVKGYQKLCREDRVSAVIGPWSAGVCVVLAPVADAEGVPVISHCSDLRAILPGSAAEKPGTPLTPRKCFFLSRPTAAEIGVTLAGFAADWLGLTRFACLFDPAIPASVQQEAAFEHFVLNRGRSFVFSGEAGPGGALIGSGLDKARRAGAEAVLVATGSIPAAGAGGLPASVGVRALLFGEEVWPPSGAALPWTDRTGIFAASATDPTSPASLSFEERFRRAFGRRPGFHAAAAHDDLFLVLAAVRLTGSRLPSVLRAALETVDARETLSGGIAMDPAAHKPLPMPLTIFTFADGLPVTVRQRYAPQMPR